MEKIALITSHMFMFILCFTTKSKLLLSLQFLLNFVENVEILVSNYDSNVDLKIFSKYYFSKRKNKHKYF